MCRDISGRDPVLKRHSFKKALLNSEHGPFFSCKGIGRCIKICVKMQFSLTKTPSNYWPEISLMCTHYWLTAWEIQACPGKSVRRLTDGVPRVPSNLKTHIIIINDRKTDMVKTVSP